LEKQYDHVIIKDIAYADSLKKSVAEAFGFDYEKLKNTSPENRDWMMDYNSDESLFWTTGLLKSKYTGYKFDKMYSDEKRAFQEPAKKEHTTPEQFEKSLFNIAKYQPKMMNLNMVPVTPRKMVDYVANEMYREYMCDDFWVLSVINKLRMEETRLRTKQLPMFLGTDINMKPPIPKKVIAFYILRDTRFLHEVRVPAYYGAKVIYIHIRRQKVLNSVPWYPRFEKYLSENTQDNNHFKDHLVRYPNRVPPKEIAEEAISRICKDMNVDVPISVRWMPIWLQHYIRANYMGDHLHEFNQKNGQYVRYYDVKNEENDLDGLRKRLGLMLEMAEILPKRQY